MGDRRHVAAVMLGALGVAYGDIGTSPLYALRECFSGDFGIAPEPEAVLGVLSLVFWALMIVVSTKYLGFVLRADNHGEGGVMALTALLKRRRALGGLRWGLFPALGLFAAALLYGDGMITPAISVLSAVEGLGALHEGLEGLVVPVTLAILVGLFAAQSRGTARVGAVFGPVMVVWFATLALLGLMAIWGDPRVCAAVWPTHALGFLARNGRAGFLVLGAVFLVVTGAEALYADMGHFGRKPIRRTWWLVVLPALLLNYFGQGALLLSRPEAASDPFYALAPTWLLPPLIALATMATIIASQAVISGAFSLTRQAIQLGFCPRMRVVHTSPTEIGQVYVPTVNWVLMLATLGLVVGFRSSGELAAAYGFAVMAMMLVTTLLFAVVARRRFGWNRLGLGVLVALFLVVDVVFFATNLTKLAHGAWFPLLVAGAAFAAMTTWRKGRVLLTEALRKRLPRVEDFVRDSGDVPRVPRIAVFLTSDPSVAPSSILHNMKHNRVLHATTAFLTVLTESVPRVPPDEKVAVEDLGHGFHRITARYGFYESPDVPEVLALAREKGLHLPLEAVSFFLARERVRAGREPGMEPWRERFFAFLMRNALGATTYYGIPPGQVVEIGAEVEI